MKKLFTPFFGLLMMLTTHAQAAEFETAKDAVKNMGVGWNLGNTLDANDANKTWTSTSQHETCWGQPVTKPELMKMMKEAGFGAIRVPVTWYQEMDSSGKVNAAWMNRVKEVVDYVIDQGMYCILNVHHDTGADSQTFKSWLKASGDNYKANKDKYEYLWRQIAETFRNYEKPLLYRLPYLYYRRKAERDCLRHSDVNLTVTAHDAEVFRSWYPGIHVYPWGIFEHQDTPRPVFEPPKDKHTFVITGSLYFRQSLLPIIDFVRRYWPLVLQACPDAKLIIAGRNPAAELLQNC